MKKNRCIMFVCLILFTLSSCVITENMSINSSHTDFTAFQFMEDLMEDISCWTDNGDGKSVMDKTVESIGNNIIYTGSSSDVRIEKKTEHNYTVDFSFEDLNQLIARMTLNPNQNLVVMKQHNGKMRMEINLNLENYDTLTQVIPVLSDPNLEVYGPKYNNPPYENRTEEEYLFMIDFIFGSGSQSIKSSAVNLTYTAPSVITATNGTALGNTASFSFPLIDFILLHEPIYLYCEW